MVRCGARKKRLTTRRDWCIFVYARSQEIFGSDGTLGRADTREAVLKRELRAAPIKLNPGLPAKAIFHLQESAPQTSGAANLRYLPCPARKADQNG